MRNANQAAHRNVHLLTRGGYLLCLIGCLTFAIPAVLVTGGRTAWMLPMFVGSGLLAAVAIRAGVGRPATALAILIALNLAYWLSFSLWLLRTAVFHSFAASGEDPFMGAVALWVLIFPAVSIYQVVVFARSVVKDNQGEHRTLSIMGLAAVALQVSFTLRMIWDMIQGV